MPGRSRMKEALALAEQHGAAEAARRTGVKASTIRSHQSRERKATTPGDDMPAKAPAPVLPPPEPVEASTGDGRLAGMRRALAAARRVEAQAIAQTESLLAQGDAGEARNAAAAGGIWSDKALALEKAIVAAEGEAEAEAARLKGETLELQASVIRATFEAVGIPTPTAAMRELAACAAAGEPLQVPEDIAAADRERVRAAIRSDLLPEVRQQVLDELAAEGLKPDDADADDREDDDAGEHEDESIDAEPTDDRAQETTDDADSESERELEPWEELRLDEYRSVYMNEATARREFERDLNMPKGSMLVGYRPSIAAARRQSPSGSPGGLA